VPLGLGLVLLLLAGGFAALRDYTLDSWPRL
jgi:hypothetical protein